MVTKEKDKTNREKDTVRDTIYAQRDRFVQLAHDIHEHPQLAFTEEYAAARITEVLAGEGFVGRTGVYNMPTAFIASFGNGPLHIAFGAEYDALPPSCLFDRSKPPGLTEVWLSPERQDTPLRHACGHNLIAGAAVAAATGLRDIADEVGLTVTVFGTPGEEFAGLPEPPAGIRGPGKALLFEAGAFEGVHAVLMVHPGPTPFGVIIPSKAYVRMRARFTRADAGGRILGEASMRRLEEALKQSIISLYQVPALFVAQPEGEKTGAKADILWIATTLDEANRAREPVRRCFEEAASSAGVAVDITDYVPFPEMRHDPILAAAYRKNAEALGRVRVRDESIQEEIRKMLPFFPWWARILRRFFPGHVPPPGLFMDKYAVEVTYGTDLANVSHMIPAIHPYIGIGGIAANHSAEFAAQADTDEAYRMMLDGGVALAWTALDAATDPSLRAYLLEAASARVGSSPRNV
jgi:metal-dependent amidase/aminoacylase/carboxypeptidase family protein